MSVCLRKAKPFLGVRTNASTSRSRGGGGRGLDEASVSASCFACTSSESGDTTVLRRGREEGASACDGILAM